jgi:poly(A) polymerase
MKKVFSLKPHKSIIYKHAKQIVELLNTKGKKAFIVGGSVRDALLGLEPKEYDITTSATPDEVCSYFQNTVEVGASFGVIIVLIGGIKFEVATFRKEENYSDGRHPDKVQYSGEESEDVLRRDFTINGMLYDPISEEVIDYVGGLSDLEHKIVRTIGDPYYRFNEDKLRMMRAIRFSSRLGYEIDKSAKNALKHLASQIVQVSPERIRDELVSIITQKNPGRGLSMLSDFGLLKHILPDVETMKGVQQPPQFHPEGDVFVHTCLVIDKIFNNSDGLVSAELALGGLLHDVGKPPTYSVTDRIRFNGHDRVGASMSKKICRKLKLSNKQIKRIVSLVREHLRFKDVFQMRDSTFKRFVAMDYFDDHLALHLADCQASHGMMGAHEFIKNKLSEFSEEEIKPVPLLKGNDLLKLGFKPGPIFTEILNSVEEMQLEGNLTKKNQAIDFVKANFPLTE